MPKIPDGPWMRKAGTMIIGNRRYTPITTPGQTLIALVPGGETESAPMVRAITAFHAMREALEDAAGVLDNYADVVDGGANGQPRANAALTAYTHITALLNKLERDL